MTLKKEHKLTYERTLTIEVDVEVTPDGDILIVKGAEEEVVDFIDSHLYCSKCGLLGADEYEAHGISDEWQEV